MSPAEVSRMTLMTPGGGVWIVECVASWRRCHAECWTFGSFPESDVELGPAFISFSKMWIFFLHLGF